MLLYTEINTHVSHTERKCLLTVTITNSKHEAERKILGG